MMDLSPEDRDAVARTMLSEAGSRSAPGLAAVGSVIKNRYESGDYGDSPRAVVTARGQFEPWSLPRSDRNHPLNHDPKSPEYQKAAAIADAVFQGRIPDLSKGSQYFYDPAVQSAMGRKTPKWAQGEPNASVGGHLFYSAPGTAKDPLAAINGAIGTSAIKSGAMAYDSEAPAEPSIFESAGFKVPKAAPAAAEPPGRSIFEAAGFKLPTAMPSAPTAPPANLPPGAADTVTVPGGVPSYVDKAGKFLDQPGQNPRQDAFVERARNVTPVGEAITNAFHSSRDVAGQGLRDIGAGKSATGVGETFWGGAGMLASPLTGAVNALISEPASKIGGSEFGERAGLLASLAGPGSGSAKVAQRSLPSNKAVNALVDAIGPENVPAAVERLRGNNRLAPMDVAPTVRQLTQGLAVQPGMAQNVIAEATKARGAGARGAVGEAYNELGPPPQALQVLDQIKARAKEAGREEIQPALDKAGPVDVSPVIRAIDAELKPGMQEFAKSGLPLSTRQQELARLRQQLTTENGETLVDPKRLHEVQYQNGNAAYQFSKSPDAAQRRAGAGLRDINEKLVDAIDAASGGAYRPARAKFAEAKDVHEAFDRGLMLQRARQGEAGITEDSPEAWTRWAAKATPDQLDAARLGALSAIQMKIGSVRNAARAGMDIPEVEFTRDKLGILFGKDKAAKMLQQLRDERDIATTNTKLFGNSETAARLKGEEALAVPKVGGGNPLQYVAPVAAELLGQSAGFPFVGLAGTTALKGAHLGFQKLAQMNALARNTAFARLATASGPEREAVINRLATHPKVVRALQKRGNALAPALDR
jgi:hypothetical protein